MKAALGASLPQGFVEEYQMIEQHLAERFKAVVGDEPPLGFDPDALVDGLLRRRRHRQAIGAALGVALIATTAVAGVAMFGGGAQRPASPLPTLVTLPPTSMGMDLTVADFHIGADAAVAPVGQFQVFAERTGGDLRRRISDFLISVEEGDKGTLQVRRDDEVLFESTLEDALTMDYHFMDPFVFEKGQRAVVAVNCVATAAADGVCRSGVTFSASVGTR
jgi:hypothetical protein